MSVNQWRSVNTWDAGSPNNYILTLDSGNYSLTGQDATLTQSNRMPIEPGNYTLTGTAINFAESGQNPVNHVMSLDSGNYGLTGNNATLKLDSQISTETGNYNSIFNTVNLLMDSGIILSNGHYNYTGSIVNMAHACALRQRATRSECFSLGIKRSSDWLFVAASFQAWHVFHPPSYQFPGSALVHLESSIVCTIGTRLL